VKNHIYLSPRIIILFFILFGCSVDEDNNELPPSIIQTSDPEPEPPASTSNPTQYTLTVTSSEGGSVSTEGGTYDEGTEIKITATPNEGYEFVGWEGNDSENSSITIILNSDITLQTLFSLIPPQFTLTVSAGEGGTVNTGGGTYIEGTEIFITATPEEGYEFIRWEGIESNETTIPIILNSNQAIRAIFGEILQIPSLKDNLNFDSLNTKINIECTFVLKYDEYRFFISNDQPFLSDKSIVVSLNNSELSAWTDQNNYLIFWFNNSNNLFLIQVYKNQSFIKSFNIENDLNEQLNLMTSFFDNDVFYSQTKFNSDSNNEIEDGIYLHSEYIRNISINENDDKFGCINYSKSFFYNHLNEKGKEYFKIIDGQIVGRSLIFDSDLSGNYRVWSLSDWYITDIYTNKSRSVSRIEDVDIDDYTLNNLNLFDPVKLFINDEIGGVKSEMLLTKVSEQDIGINMVNSFEGLGLYVDEVYSQIDFDDPSSYLNAFIQDAVRHGVDLSYIDTNKYQFTIIPDNEWTSSASAYASRICDNDQIDITFKESVWSNSKIPYKTSVPDALKIMWHELGHDILNLDHVCLGDHIMSGRHQDPKIVYSSADCEEEYITIYGMDWDNADPRKNFQRAVDDMFSGFEQVYFNCTTGKNVIIY